MNSDDARAHLAWLIWCYSEGYVTAEDRDGMENWLLDEPDNMHPEDVKEREALLGMADSILADLEWPNR